MKKLQGLLIIVLMKLIMLNKSFQYVGNTLYIGNYIGFRDYNNQKTFMDIDLQYLFLYPFPNEISFYLCCPHFVSYIMLIVISLTRCCRKDQPNEGSNKKKTSGLKLIIIILYSAFCLGIFIYSIYSFHFIYYKSNFVYINKVDADEFLEDLMKEVKDVHA